MEIADGHEARPPLSRLVERALEGQEIIISRAGEPALRLVPVQEDGTPRKGGQWKGKVRIAEDFDEWPDDIARSFDEPAQCPWKTTC